MSGFDPKEIESKIISAKIFLKKQSSDFKQNFNYIENSIEEEVRLIISTISQFLLHHSSH